MFEIIWDILSDWPIGTIVGIVILMIVLVLFLVGIDYLLGKTVTEEVVVVDKGYSPAKAGTGTGVGVTPNGGVGTVMVSTYQDEEYVLIVKDMFGSIYSHSTDAKTYIESKIGDAIQIENRYGRLTKHRF